jgi:hypothetical protein
LEAAEVLLRLRVASKLGVLLLLSPLRLLEVLLLLSPLRLLKILLLIKGSTVLVNWLPVVVNASKIWLLLCKRGEVLLVVVLLLLIVVEMRHLAFSVTRSALADDY